MEPPEKKRYHRERGGATEDTEKRGAAKKAA